MSKTDSQGHNDYSPRNGSLKEEFRIIKFGLGYQNPNAFIQSQWPLPRFFYLLWRIFWFLWNGAWTIASGVNTEENKARYPGEGVKWFIYLTNIILLLTSITCLIDLCNVLYVTIVGKGSVIDLLNNQGVSNFKWDEKSSQRSKEKEEIVFHGQFTIDEGYKEYTTTWYMKLVWLLYNVINSGNILVTLTYWAVEYNGSTDAVGVVVHTINTVFVIANLIVSAMPIQILHFIYPMGFAILYFLFTFIYYELDGTDIKGRDYIYSVVDWSKAMPTAVTVSLGILVGAPLAHLVVFAIYTLRVFLHSRLKSEIYSKEGSPDRVLGSKRGGKRSREVPDNSNDIEMVRAQNINDETG